MIGTIKGKNYPYIHVRKENGEEVTIKAPDIVFPLLLEGHEYGIGYSENLVRPPFLTYISPLIKK